MKRFFAVIAATMLVLAFAGTAAAGGDSIPSAKTAAVSEEAIVVFDPTDWTTILSTQIKTAESKDLVISLSAQSLLMTQESTSGTSFVTLQVAVWVDDVLARPGPVTLNNRMVTLSGTLDPSALQMFEITSSVNSFNFIAVNVGAGVHTITAEAMIGGFTTPGCTYGFGIYERSLVVDEVRMAKLMPPAVTLLTPTIDWSTIPPQLTLNGFAWLGDVKSASVSVEWWTGLPTPPPIPNELGPLEMTSDGQFSFVLTPTTPGTIYWHRAKLVYDGEALYSSTYGAIGP